MVTAPQVFIDKPPNLPIKAPTPDRTDSLKLYDLRNSRMVAPTNTPIIEPIIAPNTGVTKAPLIAPPIPPTILPAIPHFEAPYFFALTTISRYSKNSTNKNIANNVNTNVNVNSSKLVIKPYTKEFNAINKFPGTPKKFENNDPTSKNTNAISKILFIFLPNSEIR